MNIPAINPILIICVCICLSACGASDNDVDVLIEDSYNEGYLDALDCVERKGGSAYAAAQDCEDE